MGKRGREFCWIDRLGDYETVKSIGGFFRYGRWEKRPALISERDEQTKRMSWSMKHLCGTIRLFLY